jgi:hypothetical protein
MSAVTDSDLLDRLSRAEDAFVERKPRFDADDVRVAVVAFANTVLAPNTGVLFLGVSDSGEPIPGGVPNLDEAQKRVFKALEWCYPEIPDVRTQALTCREVPLVAVVVGESKRRPHFTGPAYIRVGSSSKRASEELFEQLIADRVAPARVLRPWLGRSVRLEREMQHPIGRYPPQWAGRIEQATLTALDARSIRLQLSNGPALSPTWQRIQVEPGIGAEPPLVRVALW